MMIRKIDEDLSQINAKSGVFPFQLNISLYIAGGVLIDAGSGNILKKLKPVLKKEKIICAALTHVHEDHTGAASWIRRDLGLPVYLKENSIPEAAEKSAVPLYRRLVWGNRAPFTAVPMPDYIDAGRYRLDVINAPGHHRDHQVFHEKGRGWLFTGDLYVSRRQAVAFKDENISDAIASIKKLLQLDFDTIFCGHSGIHRDGKRKLAEKLENFLSLQEQVYRLRGEGLKPEEINRRLFPEKKIWEIISRGEWSSLKMIETV